jgi:hypothetical protein
MSSDKDHAADHSADSSAAHADAHGGHDGQAPATDIIPESSPQDMLLKLITVAAAVLISGTFLWWYMLPLSGEMESHAGGEAVQH